MAHGDITHLEIPFDDKTRATAFYRDLAGWDIQEVPEFPDYPMWAPPSGPVGGGMGLRADAFQFPRLYVEVTSIDDVVARATELGGRLVEEKDPIGEGSWVAVISDLDGNQIGLYEGVMTPRSTGAAGIGRGSVTHVDIPVSDMTQAASFYNALFGWDPQDMPGFEGYPMWRGPDGISGGGLAPRDDGFTQPRPYIQVDSIEQALAQAEAAGGRVAQPRQPIDDTSW